MIDEIIDLRNRVHDGDFRFVLTPEHWKVIYVPENSDASNLVTVEKDGKLRGYAAFYPVHFEQVKAYDVREICAADEEALNQLLDKITEKGLKDDVDFVFAKLCQEPYGNVFSKKGFASFIESVVMIALFDPRELLSPLSEKVADGKVLKLMIKDVGEVTVKVGKHEIMTVEEGKPDFVVSTDSRTFLRLFFGRTSFLKEFFRRRIAVSGISSISTANHFFTVVRQSKWYIPMGDWV